MRFFFLCFCIVSMAWCAQGYEQECEVFPEMLSPPRMLQRTYEELGQSHKWTWFFEYCNSAETGTLECKQYLDQVVLMCGKKHLTCTIPHTRQGCSGNVFSVQFFDREKANPEYYQHQKISVICDLDDDYEGKLYVTRSQLTDDVEESFPLSDTETLQNFCAYDVQTKRLSITRFLTQYDNESRFFVQINVDYDDISHAVVRWGNDKDEGSQNSYEISAASVNA